MPNHIYVYFAHVRDHETQIFHTWLLSAPRQTFKVPKTEKAFLLIKRDKNILSEKRI